MDIIVLVLILFIHEANSIKEYSVGPEFIDDNPENKTALLGSKVVFQCRVKSTDPAIIKWFRRTKNVSSKSLNDVGHMGSHMLPYNGFVYELLESSGEKILDRNSYISKLILYSIKNKDEGFYACVAIIYRGHILREAYLKILENHNEQWYDYDSDSPDTSKFWLLFLIPLGLALLPLIVWILFIILKSSHDNKTLMR